MLSTGTQVAMGILPGGGAAPGGAAGSGSSLMSLLPLVLIFVLFYLLFIMPQRKQQKEAQAMLKALKKGDDVVTTGGIFGSIVGFNERENTVYLKIGENVKIEIQRSGVAGMRKPAAVVNVSQTPKSN